MDIRKLQQQAAASVDELLLIGEDMETYVIAVYGSAPQEVVAMQCRIQLERLRRLETKLTEIQKEITDIVDGDVHEPPSRAGALSEEQRRSMDVTRQLIAQNLLLIAQKQELLNGFLTHSDMIGAQRRHAKELDDTAEIIRLKNALRGEAVSCRTESER